MSARVWEAPQPPGDEVTHVRDRRGVVWLHEGPVWWANLGNEHDDYKQWFELLGRGPLTDATNEGTQ